MNSTLPPLFSNHSNTSSTLKRLIPPFFNSMGNYASCALSGPNAKHSKSAAAKVIFPSGEIQSFYEPITAAELMLERPNCFLVNSQSLQIGRRLAPLSADEELEMANVYVLFPKQRLNSVVNTADMGALFLAAKRGSSSASNKLNKARVSSSEDSFQVVPMSVSKSSFEDVEEFFSPDVKHMLHRCRSKKPMLDTIVE